MSEHTHQPEPAIAEAVQQVENRFGVQGLEELIDLAQQHLVSARSTLEELSRLDRD